MIFDVVFKHLLLKMKLISSVIDRMHKAEIISGLLVLSITPAAFQLGFGC